MSRPVNLRTVCGILGSVLLFAVSHAGAATLTTTDFITWKTTFITGAPTQLNFYPINSASYNTAAGIILSPSGSSLPFVFTGPDNGGYSLSGDIYGKALLGSPDAGASINIALPGSGENAFLLGVGATPSKPTTISLSNGQSFSFTSSLFGAAFSQPILWVKLASIPGSQAYVNDFLFGTSALPQDSPGGPVTPEPATLWLCLSGGALVIVGARCKRAA